MIFKLFRCIKRIVVAMLLIYSFNVVAVSLNLSVPINLITVLLISVFDVPALMCFVFFSFLL